MVKCIPGIGLLSKWGMIVPRRVLHGTNVEKGILVLTKPLAKQLVMQELVGVGVAQSHQIAGFL